MNKKICILMATVLSVLYLSSCSSSHTHSYENIKVVKPTCTENGYTLHTCECGDSYKSDETKKLGHDGEWIVINQPSCTKNGKEEYRCKRCNAVLDSKSVSGHKYVDNKCSLCGDIESGHIYVELPTLPLAISNGYTISKIVSIEKKSYYYTKDWSYAESILTFKIQKTWDKKGESYSRSCVIGYKLYDEDNIVVESGTIYTEAMCVGESSIEKLTISGKDIPEGKECRLVLLNVD